MTADETAPYSVYAGGRHVAEKQPPFKPGQLVALSCACGFLTLWWPIEHEHLAAAELAEHKAEHLPPAQPVELAIASD